jgi:hypothetical protein
MIVIQARAIRIDGRLPMELSNECCLVAVYLLNRTPVELLGWKTLYEVVHGQKPSVAHFNVVGARAYVLNNKLKRGEKLESRALIGQLVGYDYKYIPSMDASNGMSSQNKRCCVHVQ